MRGFLAAFATMLGACAAEPRPMWIEGPYASRLSAEDVRKIKVAADLPEAPEHLPVQYINAVGLNKVVVDVGTRDDFVRIPLVKRNGKWRTDDSPQAEVAVYHRAR